VRPTRCRCSKSHVCRRDSGSIPDVGSSSITTFMQYNHNKQIWLRVQGKNSVLAGCSGIQGSTWRSHRAGGLYGACGLQLHRFHIRCSHQSALVPKRIQWHRLDHMHTIVTSLQMDNHTNTPSLNFYRLDALPDTQPTVSNK